MAGCAGTAASSFLSWVFPDQLLIGFFVIDKTLFVTDKLLDMHEDRWIGALNLLGLRTWLLGQSVIFSSLLQTCSGRTPFASS